MSGFSTFVSQWSVKGDALPSLYILDHLVFTLALGRISFSFFMWKTPSLVGNDTAKLNKLKPWNYIFINNFKPKIQGGGDLKYFFGIEIVISEGNSISQQNIYLICLMKMVF